MKEQKSAGRTAQENAAAQEKAGAADFINEPTLLREVLPISRRTAKNWRDSGVLPYCKTGSRVLYHLPSVRAAMLRQQHNSPNNGNRVQLAGAA
jgi:protein tyrosine phosphatase (PTP) superfamily phosphohydrolase (DUF442 family)